MPSPAALERPHEIEVDPFPGFEHPTANFLYCPNQFFDVCLANYSRGVVRLVSYILRRTLGWLDRDGNPVEQNISVSYHELVTKAGISRGAIRKVIDEAIAGGFILCTSPGQPNTRGHAAQTARYALRWDKGNGYAKEARQFTGFYAGEGHRSPIPNAFFDHVIPRETLAVVKIVGSVLRHTVGYQNQYGGRRSQAPLSFRYLQSYAQISDRSTLAKAMHYALKTGYIRCVEEGRFHPSSKKRRASSYAIRWLGEGDCKVRGSRTRPAAKSRSRNQTSDDSQNRPAKQFRNQTKENTPSNDTYKQQHCAMTSAVAAENIQPCQLLREAGFDDSTASRLSGISSPDEIRQQIMWLEQRNPQRNPLGLLRRAIEEHWPPPVAAQVHENQQAARERERQRETEQIADDNRRQRHDDRRRESWFSLSTEQRQAFRQAAVDGAHPRIRSWLEEQTIDNPVSSFLIEMDQAINACPDKCHVRGLSEDNAGDRVG